MNCKQCNYPYAYRAIPDNGIQANTEADRVYCTNCKGWFDFDKNEQKV